MRMLKPVRKDILKQGLTAEMRVLRHLRYLTRQSISPIFFCTDEKRVFSQLYKGLSGFESSVDLAEGVISKDDIGAFISMLTSACPYIDYMGSQYTICIDGDGYVTSVEVTYDKTAEEAQAEKEKLDKKVGEILAGIEQGWSDYDKVLYFHDSIILECNYDDTAKNCYSAYGCLVEGKAVCEGYAKAMQILCSKAGIKCIPVAGKAYDGGCSATFMEQGHDRR